MPLARTVLLAALLVACDRGDPPPGLPPASEWKPPAPQPARVEGARRGGKRTARGSASHRLDVDAKKQAAGLADEEEDGPAAGETDEDPHGPDPDHGEEAEEQPEERGPRQTLARGQIRAAGDAAGAVKPGSVLYVSAVPIDSSGNPSGSAIAVDRFEVTSLPMPFALESSPYQGEVLITAWTDGDGEARTREPGDAEGRVRARLPADKVDLVLDRVLK